MTNRVPFVLGKGWVHDERLVYFYGSTDEANRQDEWASIVLRQLGGAWGYWTVDTRLCGLCTVRSGNDRRVICVGIDGTVLHSDRDGDHVGTIDASEDGPNNLRHIVAIRVVGEQVYAVGMSRMVYRLGPEARQWSRIDDGIRVNRSSPLIAGLRAIDGDGRGRLLAAGLSGEIWLHDDRSGWRQVESPTNMKLEAVRWVREDLVYVAGGGGVVLYGPPEALRILEQTSVRDTFWSIEWFEERLYLATAKGAVYCLGTDGLERQRFDVDRHVTTGYLHASAGRLISVGAHDVLTHDGTRWQELPPPTRTSTVPFDWTRLP